MSLLLIGIIVVSAIGVADGLYLINLKVENEATGNAASRVCEAINQNGCSVALESPVSSIGPVPLSLIGVATYVVIILLALRWWRYRTALCERSEYQYEGAAIASIALASVGLSLALALYSALVSSWCLFCIGLYVVNVLLLILVSKALRCNPLTGCFAFLQAIFRNKAKFSVTLIVFAALIAIGQLIMQQRVNAYAGERLQSDRARMEKALKLGTFEVDLSNIPVAGPADAPITVVKLSDFECPYCKKMWTSLEAYRKRNPNRLRIAFIHSPLDESCNPMMRPFHEQACEAAYAAQCAHEQGKFFEMADQLFDAQPEFDSGSLKNIATMIGLRMDAWNECFASTRVKTAIENQALFSRAVGAAGTPSSLLLFPGSSKGLMLTGGFGPASLKTFATELAERIKESPPPESPLVLARRAAQDADDVGPKLNRPIVDIPANGKALDVLVAVDPTDAAGRAQVDAAWKLAAYFRHIARVQLIANPPETCRNPAEPGCRPSAILACATRMAEEDDRLNVIKRLATANSTDLSAMEEELRASQTELDECLASPAAALKEDQDTLRDKLRVGERPHIWIDGTYFDGPLTRQEIDSHIASILLGKRQQNDKNTPEE